MKDQKKAEEIALQRVQLLSPLLAEGLEVANLSQIKAEICVQTGLSDRKLRRYETKRFLLCVKMCCGDSFLQQGNCFVSIHFACTV